MRVYCSPHDGFGAVRAVDRTGTIRVQRSRALAFLAAPQSVAKDIETIWRASSRSDDGHASAPGLFLLYDAHVADLSGVETLAQAIALATSELEKLDADAPIVLIGVPAARVP